MTEKEIAEIKEKFPKGRPGSVAIRKLISALEESEKERDGLGERSKHALTQYGRHTSYCGVFGRYQAGNHAWPCDCGLDAALKALDGQGKDEV